MARAVRCWQIGALVLASLAAGVVAAQPPDVLSSSEPDPSPLLIEPKTPEEMFASSMLMVDLARFDLAKVYLEQFLNSDPSDELLLSLRDKHGTAEFLRLSRVKDLNPAARQILEKLNAASRRQADDPAFIDSLVARLFGRRSERDVATAELRNIGANAVPEMLKQLALREDPAERDVIVLALVRMGRGVAPVLIGGLQSPVDAIRNASIEALRLLNATEAMPFLWSLGYSPDSASGTVTAARQALSQLKTGRADRVEQLSSSLAVEELRAKAWALYTNQDSLADPLADGPTETIIVWRWDDEFETVRATEVRSEHAALDLATRLSREALAISPERADLQRLYLGTLLAGEVQHTGWERPPSQAADGAWQTAVSAGEPVLLDVLRDALAHGRSDTAWATLQALNQVASKEVLRSPVGKPSPVLSALNYPDPRVQFAATIVVLRAEPQTAFPSASRVTAILRRALTDPGQARALVIDADQDRATTVGGYLAEQGYDPIVAATGREGFQIAADQTGIELVVIQANVIRWDLTPTIANFRADARTAFLPLVIYGPEETRTKTARLIARSQPAVFAADSAAAAAFWEQVQPFVKRFRTPPISGQQRSEFKTLAAYWLATIANGPMARLFDVSSTEDELLPLVDDPDVAGNVLAALSSIPTAKVQSRLAEFANNPRLLPATRITAATQLSAHITRFGMVLPAAEVDALTQTWQSTADVNLKAALAAVMGALKPSAGLVGERLRRATIPKRSSAP
jgi:CheY-like chemotaxis protein